MPWITPDKRIPGSRSDQLPSGSNWLLESRLKQPLMPRSSMSRLPAAIVIFAGLGGIFFLDRSTGTAPVQHLYYLPIIYAASTFEAPGSISTAVAAIVLYHLANRASFADVYHELDVLQVILFMTVAIVAARLASDARRLRVLATTDDLTGLHNLRSFESQLTGMVGVSRLSAVPLVLMALDVDRLKLINDVYGHLAGADAVRAVGQVIAATLPANAVACHYGGDEFLVAVPAGRALTAGRIAYDLCRAVHSSEPVLAGQKMPAATLSVSIGMAEFPANVCLRSSSSNSSDQQAAESLFRAADLALYAAKAGGRNRLCDWQELSPGAGQKEPTGSVNQGR